MNPFGSGILEAPCLTTKMNNVRVPQYDEHVRPNLQLISLPVRAQTGEAAQICDVHDAP